MPPDIMYVCVYLFIALLLLLTVNNLLLEMLFCFLLYLHNPESDWHGVHAQQIPVV